MRSEGSRFTLGVWGLRVCSLDVTQPPATFATVHAIAIWRKFSRRGHVGCFQRRVASFRVAGMALRDIQTCFVTCRKSFCVAGTKTFATFSEDALQFSWQAQHFGCVHRHFAWQAQHFRRVVLLVFCESHWQGCVKWRQGADSVASVAFCEMC